MSHPTKPDKVVLVGMMGAGKSTVGKLLADRLGYDFVDLDAEVEALAGRSIPEIFDAGGETRFRELEEEATVRQDEAGGTVLAAGGGWMARPEIRDRWPGSVRVWLRVTPEESWNRLADDAAARPMLDPAHPTESLERLLAEREAAYALAEISVSAGDASGQAAAEETADLIVQLLPFAAHSALPHGTASGS
jgi:shikimate kinase